MQETCFKSPLEVLNGKCYITVIEDTGITFRNTFTIPNQINKKSIVPHLCVMVSASVIMMSDSRADYAVKTENHTENTVKQL